MSNYYNSFQDASNSNWELLVELFGKSDKFKLIKPRKIDSDYDGILSAKKDGKDLVILVEVKRRQFDVNTLQNEYANCLFLEKNKYIPLHKCAEEYAKVPGREVKIWYISKTSDGVIFVHDITNKDYNWVSTRMNSVTYTNKQTKKLKLVALLHTADAIFARKTNIFN